MKYSGLALSLLRVSIMASRSKDLILSIVFALLSFAIYERMEGRREVEIGFIAEELPEFLRRGGGYDLKALVAILAWKITKIEEALSELGVR